MSTVSTDVPTEPGLFLFYGIRRSHDLAGSLERQPVVELVRAGRNAQGHLTLVGSDFFFKIEEIVGVWMELDLESFKEIGRSILLDSWVKESVKEYKSTSRFSPPSFEGYLSEVTSRWGKNRYKTEDRELAETLAARAVELELLPPEEK